MKDFCEVANKSYVAAVAVRAAWRLAGVPVQRLLKTEVKIISLYAKVWFSFRVLANLAGKTHKSASNLVQIEQIPRYHPHTLKTSPSFIFEAIVVSLYRCIVDCETCIVFFEFASIFNASYVAYPVLHMRPIQCFICSISDAPYVTYPLLHIRPTQCFICSISDAPYVTYPLLHMWPTQCSICDLSSASYVVYSVPHM